MATCISDDIRGVLSQSSCHVQLRMYRVLLFFKVLEYNQAVGLMVRTRASCCFAAHLAHTSSMPPLRSADVSLLLFLVRNVLLGSPYVTEPNKDVPRRQGSQKIRQICASTQHAEDSIFGLKPPRSGHATIERNGAPLRHYQEPAAVMYPAKNQGLFCHQKNTRALC